LIKIVDIAPGCAAERLGIGKGDEILAVNGEEVHDVIDYRFLVAEERVILKLRTPVGKTRTVDLEKDPDDTLGLTVAPFPVKRCRNKCIFCFVDQMPPACRKSLYVKDDDFRASFLYGNYITLGALSENDWQRIFHQRLSPLYVSVHATDPALRTFILGNKKAPDIMGSMRRLAAGGISMHAQIVLCPGVNDGPFLRRTLDDLSGLFPSVLSIAVVPVGLTAFRKELFPLRAFSRQEARAVIDDAARFGTEWKKRHGARLVFASDEFYIKAGVPMPPARFYEDFPQIENGVGMVADFLQSAGRTRVPAAITPLRATLVTGVSFSGILKETAARLNGVRGLSLRLLTVRNKFFGYQVTVAGLLTGSDIAAALEGKRLGDLVVIPAEALKEDDGMFLDGMSLGQLSSRFAVKMAPAGCLKDLVTLLKKGREEQKA
jgi:putative radical SAM enzyme (TIGR03279 family)